MLQTNPVVPFLTTLPSLLACFSEMPRSRKISKMVWPMTAAEFLHTVPAKSLLFWVRYCQNLGRAGKSKEKRPIMAVPGRPPQPSPQPSPKIYNTCHFFKEHFLKNTPKKCANPSPRSYLLYMRFPYLSCEITWPQGRQGVLVKGKGTWAPALD